MTDTTPGRAQVKPFTARVDTSVTDRVKRAAYWTPGLTVSKIVTDALLVALDLLEEANGGPFPPTPDEQVDDDKRTDSRGRRNRESTSQSEAKR